jgi:hypothetical protein
MRAAGRRGRAPKRWRTTTVPDPGAALPADLIGRDFATATAALNARWCGDITYPRRRHPGRTPLRHRPTGHHPPTPDQPGRTDRTPRPRRHHPSARTLALAIPLATAIRRRARTASLTVHTRHPAAARPTRHTLRTLPRIREPARRTRHAHQPQARSQVGRLTTRYPVGGSGLRSDRDDRGMTEEREPLTPYPTRPVPAAQRHARSPADAFGGGRTSPAATCSSSVARLRPSSAHSYRQPGSREGTLHLRPHLHHARHGPVPPIRGRHRASGSSACSAPGRRRWTGPWPRAAWTPRHERLPVVGLPTGHPGRSVRPARAGPRQRSVDPASSTDPGDRRNGGFRRLVLRVGLGREARAGERPDGGRRCTARAGSRALRQRAGAGEVGPQGGSQSEHPTATDVEALRDAHSATPRSSPSRCSSPCDSRSPRSTTPSAYHRTRAAFHALVGRPGRGSVGRPIESHPAVEEPR